MLFWSLLFLASCSLIRHKRTEKRLNIALIPAVQERNIVDKAGATAHIIVHIIHGTAQAHTEISAAPLLQAHTHILIVIAAVEAGVQLIAQAKDRMPVTHLPILVHNLQQGHTQLFWAVKQPALLHR